MRIFTDGAEYGDVLAFSSTTGSPTTSSAQKRTGNYSYLVGGSKDLYITFTGAAEFYIRFGLRLPTSDIGQFLYFMSNSGSITQTSLYYDSGSQRMRAHRGDGGTLLLYQLGNIVYNQWHLLEIHYKLDPTTGIFDMKFDGVDGGTFSGNTRENAGFSTIDALRFHNGNGTSWFLDDIAVNNTDNSDGKNDNSWCGDGHVELLVPSGNSPDGGWADTWTGSDGNSVDNYALVDEVPPDSADYVEDSTPGNQDRYALTDFVGTGKQILRVWTEARAIDTVPEGAQMKLGLRLSGGDYLSAAKTLSSNYGAVKGTEYKQNPATGPANWTDGDLDAAQILIETV